MKQLSIIIVTYNNEADIFDCVRSVQTHSDLPLSEVELVVVDNNSRNPDPMFARLREQWGEDIVLIKNPVNGGYGQGNNVGLRQSTAPVALIMNPDVRLYEPIFRKAVASFGNNRHMGVLGMVQMFSETKRSNHSFYPTLLMNGYLRLALYYICNRLDCYLPSCMYIQGSCFFIRKDMFSQVGMFDETNFMYGEEEDIHYRLKSAFGSRCFAFDRSLHYIHLTQGREPDLEYMKRLADTSLALYDKKGVSGRRILRHNLQNNRLLLWKVGLKSKHGKQYKILRQMHEYLVEKLKKLS